MKGLASWTKRNDPDHERARTKLESLPESVTKHGKAVPFPFADKHFYKKHFANEQINAAIESAPAVDIPLTNLHAIQHSVKDDRVSQYLDYDAQKLIPEGTRSAKHGGLIDLPIVIQYKGKRFIHDGHHRLTAEKLAKAGTARVRLANLDNLVRS